MHEYSLSYHDRKNVYYVLVMLSSFIGIPIAFFLTSVSNTFGMIVTAPSGILIFFTIFHLFDNYIWKIPQMYSWGIIKIPNLNGKWLVMIESSESKNDIKANVNITQTYSKIKVRLTTNYSTSLSSMANIEMVDPTSFKLRYEYTAEFQKDKHSEIKRHYGVTSVFLESENEKFEKDQRASYYTESSRDSLGTMYFKRK